MYIDPKIAIFTLSLSAQRAQRRYNCPTKSEFRVTVAVLMMADNLCIRIVSLFNQTVPQLNNAITTPGFGLDSLILYVDKEGIR